MLLCFAGCHARPNSQIVDWVDADGLHLSALASSRSRVAPSAGIIGSLLGQFLALASAGVSVVLCASSTADCRRERVYSTAREEYCQYSRHGVNRSECCSTWPLRSSACQTVTAGSADMTTPRVRSIPLNGLGRSVRS